MPVVDEILREGAGRFDLLHLTGGEPFAYRELFSVIDRAIELGYPGVLVNTNGTLLDADTIAALGHRRANVHVTISIDGPARLHDRVRGEGMHERANTAVGALLEAGIVTSVMTVVTHGVLEVLPSFVADLWAAHPRLHGITLFPVGVGHAGSQKPERALSSLTTDDLRQLALVVTLTERSGIPIGVGAYPLLNPLLRALGYPAARLYACTAGRGRVCVHADLGVSPCHPVKEAVYGTWRSGLFDRIPGISIHDQLATRDFEGCRSCAHREGCGHCRAFVAASGEPLLGNDRVCQEVLDAVAVKPVGSGARVRARVRLPVL